VASGEWRVEETYLAVRAALSKHPKLFAPV